MHDSKTRRFAPLVLAVPAGMVVWRLVVLNEPVVPPSLQPTKELAAAIDHTVPAKSSGWSFSTTGLHYQLAGKGTPVVFIHGAGLDARMWNAEFDRFRANHRVLRYDIRGFGRSKVRERNSHTSDLHDLLTELQLDRVNLVGLSMGGAIAVDFALAYPKLVDSLTLAGAVVTGWERPQEAGIQFRSAARAAAEGRLADAVNEWLMSPAINLSDPDRYTETLVRKMVRDNIGFFTERPAGASAPAAPPSFERLEAVAPRTLLLVGDRMPTISLNWHESCRRVSRMHSCWYFRARDIW